MQIGEVMDEVAAGRMVLIDVREPGEVAMSGLAAGAINVPLMMVPTHCDPRHPECRLGLDPARPVAVYCASGARSGQARMVLERLGYKSVMNLGGLRDLAMAGARFQR